MSEQSFDLPRTTNNIIIFPLCCLSKKYYSGFYLPAHTNGRASLQEITNILDDINTTRNDFTFSVWPIVIYFILAFGGCAAFLTYYIVTGCKNIVNFRCSVCTSLVLLLIIIVWFFIVKLRQNKNGIKAECQSIVDKYNKDFVSRGLSWHIPPEFPKWVELWKDDKFESNNNDYSIYIPPQVHRLQGNLSE